MDSFLIKDFLQGDESIAERKDFEILTPYEINKAMDLIINNKYFDDTTKKSLLLNSWRLIYKFKPPTIEEFLTEEWIGSMSENIFPYWKNVLSSLVNPQEQYKNLILYSPIGTGKSTTVAILNLWIATSIYAMRNPKKTLGQSSSTSICNVFMGQSLTKATEVLLEPFMNILDSSEKFEQCRTFEQMKKREKEDNNKIYWTTAAKTSALAIGPNMSIKIRSTIASLLGLTILCGSVTELAFFKEAGYSDEDIMRLYNDLKGRIYSRFPKKNGLNFSILDSSPNDATFESSIDYYILNKAPKDPTNLIFKGTKWQYQPWLFSEWEKDKSKVFYIYLGAQNSRIPKIFERKEEVQDFDSRDVIECPIDTLQLAIDDTGKFVKDYCGIPTSSPNRLLPDNSKIEAIFSPQINNIYSHITALETESPEELIWNKVKGFFFIEIGKGQYEFYRNPAEERYVSVDQSISGDTTCIAVSHPELNTNGEIIDVVDMTINIIPNKSRINLDAIKFFIHDLRRLGKLNIHHVSFDQFQSDSSMQYLTRAEFEVERLSVDISTHPYLNMVQQINTGRLIVGKNIYVKNNLKSIKLSSTKGGKTKVDHELGKVENSLLANDNWETSALGFNAKDTTDAICASIELRKKYFTGSPRFIFIEESEKNIDKVSNITLSKMGLRLKKAT